MIRLALDVGNVLVNSNFDNFIKKLSFNFNVSFEDALHFMNKTQKHHDCGLTNIADELKSHFEIKSESIMETLISDWNNVIVSNNFINDIIKGIRDLYDIEIALLSNVGFEHSVRMEEVLKTYGEFDGAIRHFSCFVGARKPTLLYYNLFLQLHPEWKGCAYIDDLQDNLDASKQFGFKTLNFNLDKMIKSANFDEEETKIKSFLLSCND